MDIQSVSEAVENGIRMLSSLAERRASEIEQARKKTFYTIGRKEIQTPQAEMETAVREIEADYDARIKIVNDETNNLIGLLDKEAIQSYYAALKAESAAARTEADSIIRAYNSSTRHVTQKDAEFQEKMNYHVENETVYAVPYVLAAKEIYQNDQSRQEELSAMLEQVSPGLKAARSILDENQQAAEKFEAFGLLAMQKAGSMDNLAAIAAKQRLYELGYDPNGGPGV